MQSPIALMQRRLYPPGSHPLGALAQLGNTMAARGVLPGAAHTFRTLPSRTQRGAMGLGYLGAGPIVGQTVTGVKAGTATAGITTALGASAASAVGAGAAAGSVVPIIGTAIGAIVGLLASGVLNHRVDPEVANFNQAIALHNSNPTSVLNIANKYLVLAGLFDLEPGQIKGNIPIYKKYGRMGEQKFTTDLMNLIYNAGQSGKITANDTPTTVFNRIVQPWIDSWGYGPMTDANADMITKILLGMTAEYLMGGQGQWSAVGGQFPFTSVPHFTLPANAAVAAGNAGTPTAAAQTPTQALNAPLQPPAAVGQVMQQAGVASTGQPVFTNGSGYFLWNGQAYAPFTGGVTLNSGQPIAVTAGVGQSVGAPTVSQTSAIPIPAGFGLAGSANGMAAYQGPDGALYTWSGSTMSPLTGTLNTTGGAQLSYVSGYPASALTNPELAASSLSTNTQAGVSPYAAPTYAAPVYAAAPPAAATAGFSGAGLPTWLPWAAVAGVVGLMFATARPVPGGPRYPKRMQRR